MKHGMLVIFALLFGALSFAQYQSADEMLTNYDKEMARLTKDANNLMKDVGATEASVNALEKKYPNGFSRFFKRVGAIKSDRAGTVTQVSGGQGGTQSTEMAKYELSIDPTVNNELAAQKKALEDEKKKLAGLQAENAKVQAEFGPKVAKFAEDKKNLENQIKALDRRLASTNVNTKILEVKERMSNVDHTLDRLEIAYDDSLMGVYLRDKFGQLLSSPAFCRAKEECGKPDFKVEAKDLNQMFSGSADYTRTDYGGKVNSRGSKTNP